MENETLHRELLQRQTKVETLLELILSQTTKTNGRVGILEERLNRTDLLVASSISDLSILKTDKATNKSRKTKWIDWFLEKSLNLTFYVVALILLALGFINLPKL